MEAQGKDNAQQGRISVWTISTIVLFVLLIAGLLYWASITRKSLAPAFSRNDIAFTEQDALPATIVDDQSFLGEDPRLVFAERTVIGFDAQGNGRYHTRLFQSDRSGERLFSFYETEDITFEQLSPYTDQYLVIHSALLGTDPQVINYSGEPAEDIFVPESIGNLFSEIFSADGNKLAYIDFGDANYGTDELEVITETSIVVRDSATGEEISVPTSIFTHGDIQYARFFLRAFSDDNAILYLSAVWPGQEFGDPESLFAVDWAAGTAQELVYSSLEDLGAEQVLELVGVYPEHGFALFNRGPLIPESDGGLIDRVRLERFDLATQEMTTVYEEGSGSISNLIQDPLSPDGTRIVVENDQISGGFTVVDILTNEVLPVAEKGVFMGWAGDRNHLVYEIRMDDPNEGKPFITLKSVDLSSGSIFEVYRQTVLQEGTGLNKEGDILYSYITTN
ncbi:MAG: hypothetical protein WCV86_04405 [Patescibacteria group bacterium]|jgi:hypothetical protein